MAQEESSSFQKFVVGLTIGVAVSYAYVRLGYKPPAIVQMAESVTSEAVIVAAETSLYSPTAGDVERKRAMAVVLSEQPELLIEINNELGDAVLTELLRRKALRKAKILKQQASSYDVALSKPALRKRLVQRYGNAEDAILKQRILAAAIRDDVFLVWYLRQHTPAETDQHFVDVVMDSYKNELRIDRLAIAVGDRGIDRH